MRQLRLSELGGYPLTQERLADMQAAYKEGLEGILAMGRYAEDEGYIISGMASTVVGDNLIIADGLLYYRGRIIRFEESSYDTSVVPGAGNAVMIVITEDSTSLQMHSGATLADAITELVAYVDITLDDVTDTSFLHARLKPWLYGAGAKSREEGWEEYTNTSGAGAQPDLTMYLKYDPITNSVYCRGDIQINNAQGLSATLGTYLNVGTLPAKFRPTYTTTKWFFNLGQVGVANYLDSTSVQYVDMGFGRVGNDGVVSVTIQKPEVSVSFVWYQFSFVMPLD